MEIRLNVLDHIFDIESYPNFFSCVIFHPSSGTRWIFEVSDRINQSVDFFYFIKMLQANSCRMVGFNNIGYDYLVIHRLMSIGPNFTYADAYDMTMRIINASRDEKFGMNVWPSDQIVKQVDLDKIHHFDNVNRATSLKTLEFNMKSPNVGDLPFLPGTVLTDDQKDMVITYNCHDVAETYKFYLESLDAIESRAVLTERTGIDMTNFNDTKIGKKFFESELKKVDRNICGKWDNPRQTIRDHINIGEVILPYVEFRDPNLCNVLNHLKNTTITDTKAAPELKGLSATINGFKFDFGLGGIHGSVERQKIQPGPGEKLIDIDVKSYYPNLAIANRLYPEHLSEVFCDIYENLYIQRSSHKKGTPENAMLKLALNGVYGDSNSEYSPFFDSKYTMSITINGQLLLCMLAESIMSATSCRMIQINTDGMTMIVPDDQYDRFNELCKAWENLTKLELEEARYSAMWIRDVNNYVAQYENGDVKRKGCYEYDIGWHQDHSALVVQKAVCHAMLTGGSIRDFIYNHDDAYDFMLRAKASRSSRLELSNGSRLQKVTRYHIAHTGHELIAIYAPLAKEPTKERPKAINKGFLVAICDDIRDFVPSNLNHEWYVREAEKLLIL